jgi:hypothetical protein
MSYSQHHGPSYRYYNVRLSNIVDRKPSEHRGDHRNGTKSSLINIGNTCPSSHIYVLAPRFGVNVGGQPQSHVVCDGRNNRQPGLGRQTFSAQDMVCNCQITTICCGTFVDNRVEIVTNMLKELTVIGCPQAVTKIGALQPLFLGISE